MRNTVLITTTRTPFISHLSAALRVPPRIYECAHFADGESYIDPKKLGDVAGKRVVLVSQLPPFIKTESIDRSVMRLLMTIDLLKECGAERVDVVTPYLPYARQVKTCDDSQQGPLHLFTGLLATAGATSLIAAEPHEKEFACDDALSFHGIGLEKLWAKYLKKEFSIKPDQWCVLSPDAGGRDRAEALGELLGVTVAYGEKQRQRPDESVVLDIEGDVEGKTVVLYDDIISTGKTAAAASRLVRSRGARGVIGCFTHAVLVPGVHQRITGHLFNRLFVADTLAVSTKLFKNRSLWNVVPAGEFVGTAVKKRLKG